MKLVSLRLLLVAEMTATELLLQYRLRQKLPSPASKITGPPSYGWGVQCALTRQAAARRSSQPKGTEMNRTKLVATFSVAALTLGLSGFIATGASAAINDELIPNG